jgi:hypothetical protein
MPWPLAEVRPHHTPPGIPRDSALGHARPSQRRAVTVVSLGPPYDHVVRIEERE